MYSDPMTWPKSVTCYRTTGATDCIWANETRISPSNTLETQRKSHLVEVSFSKSFACVKKSFQKVLFTYILNLTFSRLECWKPVQLNNQTLRSGKLQPQWTNWTISAFMQTVNFPFPDQNRVQTKSAFQPLFRLVHCAACFGGTVCAQETEFWGVSSIK